MNSAVGVEESVIEFSPCRRYGLFRLTRLKEEALSALPPLRVGLNDEYRTAKPTTFLARRRRSSVMLSMFVPAGSAKPVRTAVASTQRPNQFNHKTTTNPTPQ